MTIRLRHLVNLGPKPQRGFPEGFEVSFAPMEAVKDGLGGLSEMDVRPAAQLASGSYNYFENGDILLAKVTPCFENGKKALAAGLENGAGYATSEVHVIRPKRSKIEPRFLLYLLSAEDFRAEGMASMTGAGGLRRVSEAAILNYRPKVTDLTTQKVIADFLDRETARIDQLIEKKRRFVDVLGRKWAATITCTLTNGLDADAPRKDSGVSWIGDVPEHWSVAKLGHIGRCANGINIPGDAFGSGFPFVSYGDVYRNSELPNSVDGLVQSTAEDRVRYNLKKGDVLFTRTSETIDEIGFSSVCMQEMPEAVFAGFLIRFRPVKRKLFPAFSKFLFRDDRLRAFFLKEMMIVTRASLSQGLLQRMPVVLPPLEEQQSIADYLQRKESVFMSVSEKTKTSIDRLREYRAALITAAVTGQIDVTTYGNQGATDRTLDRIEEEMQT